MESSANLTVLRRAALAAASGLALMAAIGAQTDINPLGPQVGGRAVEFQLVDQFGRSQTLKSLSGPKGTMLVFFRSADW
jgi:cytochrome oxidase Cu insertion factor (SCO1/SenC/PrrC family)